MDILPDLKSMVGRTPILKLSKINGLKSTNLYAKCEFLNPGGSIKDRIGFHMVECARASGALVEDGVIVEATAGNTAMGLAMAASHYNHPLIAVMSSKMSAEKINLLRTYGAKVVICPYAVAPSSPQHFVNVAKRIAQSLPNGWFCDQFSNQANVEAHYLSTGPEIWDAFGDQLDVLVCGLGTGGTLTGVATYLKQRNSRLRVVLADPLGSTHVNHFQQEQVSASPYWIEGIGGDFRPDIADMSLIDETILVSDADSVESAVDCFQKEGLFVGGSSGTILAAARKYIKNNEGTDQRILALLPDGGRSYLSTIYNPQWRAEKGLIIGSEFGDLEFV
ncbi:PLP-dependent cysteine synthase family protein [Pseudomonas brassicacearum]|uniref:PLP-dependent cysteine synthase family protein n=1 Tax=Pseudomonas brassicacearum TaxID=930166 RepID=UPI001D7171E5|nr:cysteine synthase family protein [Pseudomonas brassicacearum]CAH0305686.1 Putative cystathionine beta-synthase Rv1077 [Pseudomonas brassicacearum]